MTATEPESVARFREFLKIRTEPPNAAYHECAEFLVNQAKEIGLEYKVIEPVKGKPIVILTLPGTDSSLKSVMLNCHIDVVPVFEEFWTYPPYAAERVPTENGDFKIYARGSQDMKVTGSMYLEAVRKIVSSGKKLTRDVHMVFSPDEEIGGYEGVKTFVETQDFRELNVGFDLDEGLLGADERYTFLYAERTAAQVIYTTHGNTGHGSQFIEGTAIEKMIPIVNALMEKRAINKKALKEFESDGSNFRSGEITSVNLTMFNGGKQANVVPATYTVTFDIRVSPDDDFAQFKAWLLDLAKQNDAEIRFILPDEDRTITPIDRNNKFIDTFFTSLQKRGIEPVPIICPGITDARHVRSKGVPAFGFCPINNHAMLAHQHDEFVHESSFLKGIDIYYDLVSDLANVQE
ncbi:hypothetical protein BB560_001259 [Smittium megazygosporum]|uniref:Peptidase M20 dimerisation domain-containing protein n=1 Tax=Smittium megazygosporum TaxID=133381 RepID=A0A2T9ZI08_9FUNG|nr:hypothetical protein BB560_001259 [Smittium megazygosporum]